VFSSRADNPTKGVMERELLPSPGTRFVSPDHPTV